MQAVCGVRQDLLQQTVVEHGGDVAAALASLCESHSNEGSSGTTQHSGSGQHMHGSRLATPMEDMESTMLTHACMPHYPCPAGMLLLALTAQRKGRGSDRHVGKTGTHVLCWPGKEQLQPCCVMQVRMIRQTHLQGTWLSLVPHRLNSHLCTVPGLCTVACKLLPGLVRHPSSNMLRMQATSILQQMWMRQAMAVIPIRQLAGLHM